MCVVEGWVGVMEIACVDHLKCGNVQGIRRTTFIHLFTHSTNICHVSTMCQALAKVLKVQRKTKFPAFVELTFQRKEVGGTSLVVQRLRPHASSAEDGVMLRWTSFISASDKVLRLQGHARPACRTQPWRRQREQEQEPGCCRQKRGSGERTWCVQPAPWTGQVKREGLEGVLSGSFT